MVIYKIILTGSGSFLNHLNLLLYNLNLLRQDLSVEDCKDVRDTQIKMEYIFIYTFLSIIKESEVTEAL